MAEGTDRMAELPTQSRVQLPQVHNQEGIAFADRHRGASRDWIVAGVDDGSLDRVSNGPVFR
jgi:hypothetical protein